MCVSFCLTSFFLVFLLAFDGKFVSLKLMRCDDDNLNVHETGMDFLVDVFPKKETGTQTYSP